MSRSAAARGTGTAKSAGGKNLPLNKYLDQSQFPLHCLVFILPFLAIYEIGTRTFIRQHVSAEYFLYRFLNFFGATGTSLPTLAVVFILLTWHIARRDLWRVNLHVVTKMALESALLAIPVLLIGWVIGGQIPPATGSWVSDMVLSMGAGIYEELVFRLAAFTLLSMLLIDLLKLSHFKASLLMVFCSSILFSLYHCLGSEGWDALDIGRLTFRTSAGLYFGAVFILRGFGITAGCHAIYDIYFFTISHLW